ncbi:hypothetical protein [Gordonia aquimaris]|uniref:Uncharacterized protein n=1 Tax=Gordonia aquimaris TaxID=2984863 RepID=A0A9X3I5W3_9ACTN|nr:hypothetical protein [Gordonia aquimaris]MCX2966223.1 hypothetical protein [Gordonia aquimaris]
MNEHERRVAAIEQLSRDIEQYERADQSELKPWHNDYFPFC